MGVDLGTGYSQVGISRPHVRKHRGLTLPETGLQPEPQFSGSFKKKVLYPAAMLAMFVPGLATPVMAQGTGQAPVISREAGVVNIPESFPVSSASQLPALTRGAEEMIIDANFLTPEDKAYLVGKMNQCRIDNEANGSCADIMIVALGQSEIARASSASTALAKDIFQSLKLGQQSRDDGFVFVFIKDRLLVNSSGSIGYGYGSGLNRNQIERLMNDMNYQTWDAPILRATELQSQGRTEEASRLLSKMVRDSYDQLETSLRSYKANLAEQQRRDEISAAEAKERYAAYAQTAGIVFLFLLLLSGAITGGVYGTRRRRRTGEVLELVGKNLKEMGSPHEVNRGNLFSRDTLGALLDHNPPSGKFPQNTAGLVEAVDIVADELWPHTADFWPAKSGARKKGYEVKPVDKLGEKEKDQIIEISADFIEKGLSHPLADIRLLVIESLQVDGLQAEEYDAFVELLGAEDDYRVIDALVKPVTENTTEEKVPQFQHSLQTSDKPGLRALSLSVLEKFSSDDTLGEVFSALEKETEPELVGKFQDAIARLSGQYKTSGKTSELLRRHVAAERPLNERRAALRGFQAVTDAGNFEHLFETFKANTEVKLDPDFHKALSASTTAQHFNVLHQGLSDDSNRVQQLVIELMDSHPSTKHVQPLLDYLATVDTKYPAEATRALVDSTGPANEATLKQVVINYQVGEQDREPMLAALAGLKKLGGQGHLEDRADLELLVGRLSEVRANDVREMLYQVMEHTSLTGENFSYLYNTVMSSPHEQVRIASALVMDNYPARTALEPLFEALERTSRQTSRQEIAAYETAITKLASDEDAFPIFLRKANSNHSEARAIATSGSLKVLDTWNRKYSYDSSGIMKKLKKIAEHDNQTVANKAKEIRSGFITSKVSSISSAGETGDFSTYSSNYTTLQSLASRAPEQAVRNAASSALSRLDSRRRAYEAEQKRLEEQRRQQREAAARAARAAASSASRTSISSVSRGGSYGGGGGR